MRCAPGKAVAGANGKIQDLNAPPIDARYWAALMVASVLGTNTGDFAAEILGLGHLAGLPLLVALLALIFVAQFVMRSTSPLFLWAAIIVIRTAATNVGDIFQDRGISFSLSVPLMSVAYAVLVGIYARAAGRAIVVDPLYWATMIVGCDQNGRPGRTAVASSRTASSSVGS